jgi:uncharacterized membrane protein
MSSDTAPDEGGRAVTTRAEGGLPAGDLERRLGTDGASSATPAVRGRSPGREGWTGAASGNGLSSLLGWFSVGLGVAQIVAPGKLARLIGVRSTARSKIVMQAVGVREVAHGVGILSNPRSKEWVGTRLGGDALDLALLGVALAKSERRGRTIAAAAAVLGVGALDLLETQRLAERRKAASPADANRAQVPARRSITVEHPQHEAYAAWRDFGSFPRFMRHVESVELLDEKRSRWRTAGPAGSSIAWETEIVEEREPELIAWRSTHEGTLHHEGRVTFRAAPKGQGTIVTVEMRYAPPGGRMAAALLKLFRKEPGQQLADDLRRFKQVLETGEVVLSDSTTTRRPRHAQPPQPESTH